MTSGRAVTAQASKLLTLIVFLGITVLLMWEYRVTRASQQSMAGRVAHQNEETADLIMKAITRDMRGAQTRILANRDWEAPPPVASALDMTEPVTTTFARYPYPESFFTWRGGNHSIVFFSRATRLPQWMPRPSPVLNSPIATAVDPSIAGDVRRRLLSAIAAQQRYAVFDIDLADVPYQVVARITYADSLREHLESVSGFTVNLDWVRQWYFADILSEVKPSASGGLTQDVALVDEHDRTVVGSNSKGPPIAERAFPLLFMDSSDTESDLSFDVRQAQWKLRVSASRDPMLLSASRRADTTLVATICARPCVNVPVLSITSDRTRAKISSAFPPLTRMPCLAARDRPETIATGTARMSGQGVATTSTATARIGSALQTQDAPASAMVAARNTMAYRSAKRDIGARERWAASTSRTIPA